MSAKDEVRFRYVGGVDEVDVRLASGRVLYGVQRNHHVIVSAADAPGLRDNPNWSEVHPKADTEKET